MDRPSSTEVFYACCELALLALMVYQIFPDAWPAVRARLAVAGGRRRVIGWEREARSEIWHIVAAAKEGKLGEII